MEFYCTKTANKTLLTLTNDLNEENRSKKIDNGRNGIMAVSVEYLTQSVNGDLFSISHNYEQNGDLMRDPEIVFLRKTNYLAKSENESFVFIPISFQQDNLGIYREHFTYDESGKITGRYTHRLKDCIQFCTLWMRNIKQQQGL